MAKATCCIEDCDSEVRARGWCNKHWLRWRRHGDPTATAPLSRSVSVEQRLMRQIEIDPDTGCWVWQGGSRAGDRGLFRVDGRKILAYRWLYETQVGPIPDGLELDHYRYPDDGCVGPACVNPEHLRPVTHQENMARAESYMRDKTHCPQGHLLDGRRRSAVTKSGWTRYCKICHRNHQRAYLRRRAERQR